ncbi:chaperone protein dnaJ 20, chloroplastic-like [Impatiens glandulifera]|uniref:chaperone protein dnaJ 20, chloroplastic-like n=1 Tax=Impatiens glandulifera TaxID=253017 RepID=UPI001FB050F6|nr:chaperone protein dnaJ 20, chloroplastic-like [Impatiens glandulifera]
MCCSYGLISRSNTSFSNLQSSPPIPAAAVTVTVAVSVAASSRYSTSIRPGRVSYQTQSRSRVIRAAINDGTYVKSGSISVLDNMSFYELLGISEKGSLGEIKQAYKQLARKYHPDVSPPDLVAEYTQRFIRVQEAYETLSDPGRRAMYDNDMSRGIHLAFSARKIYQSDQVMVEKSEWKVRWKSQLSELKRKKEESNNMSWGAQMRRQRNSES